MSSLWILCGSAMSIALIHTLMGPDHYLPLVALARANRWTGSRTLAVTLLCGLGHVFTSILIAWIGIAAGIALTGFDRLDAARGHLASLLLIGFGLAYTVWGIRQARRGRAHSHHHIHPDGTAHAHIHDHSSGHHHLHPPARQLTLWLVILFGLGPCEPLIPLLMFPAAVYGQGGFLAVSAVFGITTVAAMAGAVLLLRSGLSFAAPKSGWDRFSHTAAGLTIAMTGIGVRAFGL